MGNDVTNRVGDAPNEISTHKTLIALKVLRDILDNLSIVVENMFQAEQKYGISYDDLRSVDFSNVNSLKDLTESLTNEKLGILFGVATELMTLQNNFKNFPNYNKPELMEFKNTLSSVVKKLNNVLED